MASSGNESLCPDWVFLNNSNVQEVSSCASLPSSANRADSAAKDRGWFTTYTPFQSTLSPLWMGSSIPVHGVGTVELTMKPSPNATTSKTLRLSEVLHVPSAPCNVLGEDILEEYEISLYGKGETSGNLKTESGEQIAYFEPNRPLYILAVLPPAGKQLGPQVIVEGETYALNCRWDDAERRKWQEYQATYPEVNRDAAKKQDAETYSDEEKAFLKKNWGDEYHFLQLHGLSIYEDEDREEGRAILRAFIQEDG